MPRSSKNSFTAKPSKPMQYGLVVGAANGKRFIEEGARCRRSRLDAESCAQDHGVVADAASVSE